MKAVRTVLRGLTVKPLAAETGSAPRARHLVGQCQAGPGTCQNLQKTATRLFDRIHEDSLTKPLSQCGPSHSTCCQYFNIYNKLVKTPEAEEPQT